MVSIEKNQELKLKLDEFVKKNNQNEDLTFLKEILENENFIEFFQIVLNKINDSNSGYNVIFFLDQCLENKPIVIDSIHLLKAEEKYLFLDYLAEKYKNFDKTCTLKDNENFRKLIEIYCQSLKKIFLENNDNLETIKLSDIISMFSSNDSIDKSLINEDLIKLIIEKLKLIHSIGKKENEDNPFKIITKLKYVNNPEELNKETFFGFKSNLIRQLGNFACLKNEVKDWIREMEGICLIMDCMNIDARNPFIMQWAIFAMKNILEDNISNQNYVSRIKKESSKNLNLSKMF